LLTALAAEGYRQFILSMQAKQALAAPDPQAQMVAAGLGYIAFATERTALFRLIFSSSRPDFRAADLADQSVRAFEHLTGLVTALTGGQDPVDVASVWAMSLGDVTRTGRFDGVGAAFVLCSENARRPGPGFRHNPCPVDPRLNRPVDPRRQMNQAFR
jgi:hypothetical protein